MAEIAEFLVRDECGWECRAARWGAGSIEYNLAAGPARALATIRSHSEEPVAGFGSGLAEAAVLVDEVARVLLIYGAQDMVDFPARRAWWALLAQAWPGWRVDWAYGGFAELAGYAGVTYQQGRRPQPLRLEPVDNGQAWQVVSVTHRHGRISVHPVAASEHPILLGRDLLGKLGQGTGQYSGTVIPCVGVHVDMPARAVGWWATWDAPAPAAVAHLWAGWRVEFWRDDYYQQVRCCGGALLLPAEDLVTAFAALESRLRTGITGYGEPGDPVAGFVRAARHASPASPSR